MASAFLGPESHKPLSVITESYQTKLNIPKLEDDEKCVFGAAYEKKLYSIIHDHLELGTTDRMIYVGDQKGSLSQAIETHFCLLYTIQTVLPGHFHYIETDRDGKTLPFRIANVGAEEYFRNLAADQSGDQLKFDKILVNDCVRYLEHPETAYRNMIASLAPGGKILIIHRSGLLNTLPYFNEACQRLTEHDISHTNIINDLKRCHLDVSWELECLPVCMSKRNWLSLLRDKYPTQIEILSTIEVVSGIRELSEGILKYEGEMVEFFDRLVFISATHADHMPRKSNLKKEKKAVLSRMAHMTYFMNEEQLRELKRKS